MIVSHFSDMEKCVAKGIIVIDKVNNLKFIQQYGSSEFLMGLYNM